MAYDHVLWDFPSASDFWFKCCCCCDSKAVAWDNHPIPSKLQGSAMDASFVSPIPFIPIDIQGRHGSKYLTLDVRGKLQCKVSTRYVLSDGVYCVRDFELCCPITCQVQSQVLINTS